jgi:general secretion pathway protein D
VKLALLFAPVLVLSAAAADTPSFPNRQPCLTATSSDCGVSAAEMNAARKVFDEGVRLHVSGRKEEAFDAFERAARLVPRNVEFATAREFERQALVLAHVGRGNRLSDAGERVGAAAEYRTALELDPQNTFAAARLQETVAPKPATPELRRVSESMVDRLQPQPGPREFHLKGESANVIREVLQAYGIDPILDPLLAPRVVRFDVADADFETMLAALEHVTGTFVVPRGPRSAHVFPDTAETRRDNERMMLETFYLSEATTAQEINDIVSVFRAVLDMRYISVAPQQHTITVRAPQRTVDAAAAWLEQIEQGAPQVMLDITFYEVSQSALRDLGLQLPSQFRMFNLTAGALALRGGNIQDLINQLFSSGGINQANSQALQGLLAQLGNQQNSIFQTPFATFGGGKTLMGVSLPAAGVHALFTRGEIRTLEHLTLRAGQNTPATFQVGSRYPILNATFAPIFNSAAIAQVIQNNSFIAPFPSFNYENLGVNVKATPAIHGSDVTLKLEMEIKTLTSQSFNGVPVLSTRSYIGAITLANDEPGFVVGSMTRSEQLSVSGTPGVSELPGLGRVFRVDNKQTSEAELLISITPRVVRLPPESTAAIMLRR